MPSTPPHQSFPLNAPPVDRFFLPTWSFLPKDLLPGLLGCVANPGRWLSACIPFEVTASLWSLLLPILYVGGEGRIQRVQRVQGKIDLRGSRGFKG
jgi:hypothetical protein